MIDLKTSKNLIIDSSIYGMGRGAGNLNTELFMFYVNENEKEKYFVKPLLCIVDEILIKYYYEYFCGYSIPTFLSAKYNIHPNYANYLDNKKH